MYWPGTQIGVFFNVCFHATFSTIRKSEYRRLGLEKEGPGSGNVAKTLFRNSWNFDDSGAQLLCFLCASEATWLILAVLGIGLQIMFFKLTWWIQNGTTE